MHTTLCLADARSSDYPTWGLGGGVVTQCLQALTKCSPLFFLFFFYKHHLLPEESHSLKHWWNSHCVYPCPCIYSSCSPTTNPFYFLGVTHTLNIYIIHNTDRQEVQISTGVIRGHQKRKRQVTREHYLFKAKAKGKYCESASSWMYKFQASQW